MFAPSKCKFAARECEFELPERHDLPYWLFTAAVFLAALTSACLMPATNLLGPSSNVAFAKASHSPRLPAIESARSRRPNQSGLAFPLRAGTEWHSITRSTSSD